MAPSMIVFGGSGYVGSAVARLAIQRGWSVISASRTGRPTIPVAKALGPWVDSVTWEQADALDRPSVYELFERYPETTAVVSCIGALTLDKKRGRAINGDASVNIAAAVYETPEVKKMVFISAATVWPLNKIGLKGYFEGKRYCEKAMATNLGDRAVSLRPGFIYGNRVLASGAIFPLGAFGYPLELIARPIYSATQGWSPSPPISVEVLGNAAVSCASPAEFQGKPVCGILEYDDIVFAAGLPDLPDIPPPKDL